MRTFKDQFKYARTKSNLHPGLSSSNSRRLLVKKDGVQAPEFTDRPKIAKNMPFRVKTSFM